MQSCIEFPISAQGDSLDTLFTQQHIQSHNDHVDGFAQFSHVHRPLALDEETHSAAREVRERVDPRLTLSGREGYFWKMFYNRRPT